MSIATELQNLNDNILDAYTAVQGKGGTVPANKNMANLATAIGSIESIGITREVTSEGIYQMPANDFTFSLPANATDIGSYALYYAFYTCTGLTSVDLSSLTTVSGSNALSYAFNTCTRLTSVDLSSLTTLTGPYALANAFRSCTSLTSVDLSSLTTLTGSYALANAFNGCTRLTSLSFPALTTSSFGTATDQFNNMLSRVRGCTVHFPAAIQEKIETMSGYPNFGGTNTTVLFDL